MVYRPRYLRRLTQDEMQKLDLLYLREISDTTEQIRYVLQELDKSLRHSGLEYYGDNPGHRGSSIASVSSSYIRRMFRTEFER